jgi:4-amino-4-deoxy-L-arabinose transferase-like glycosyltransferase
MRLFKKPIFYILLFSLALHVLFLVKDPGLIFTRPEMIGFTPEQGKWGGRDATLYAKMANQIMNEGVYGYDTHHTGVVVQNAFVTPGHPFYLVTVFTVANILNIDQLLLLQLVNMLLSVGTVLLIYFISRQLFKQEIIAWLSALLYATYFSPLHYFRTSLTEIPGIFAFCLTLFLFLKAFQSNKTKDHILFAVIFCITVMIRPTPAPLILLAIAAVVVKFGIKKSVRIGLLWVIGPILIILPWVIRNYLAFGEMYIFSSHGGNSLFAGSNPFNVYNFRDYWLEAKELRYSQSEYAWYKIKQGFSEHFALWFSWFTIGKLFELFKFVDGKVHYYFYKGFTLLEIQHFFVVYAGFITGFLFRKQPGVRTIFIILISYVALSNLFLTITRYGFYIIPMLCILAGYGLFRLGSAIIHFYSSKIEKSKSYS